MKKQIIRLTEGDLHRIIENSVKKIIKEGSFDNIRETRYNGLVDEIDYYLNLYDIKGKLSKTQIDRLIEIKDIIGCFGEKAQKWIDEIDELLENI